MNEAITVKEVRLIDERGQQLGILSIEEALKIAVERELDLVEVAQDTTPPVCKLQDFDKLRYELKRQREKSRKLSKRQETKEIRLTPHTSDNDLMVKIRHAHKFLEAGDKVRITVKFVGREITHPELGQDILKRSIAELADMAELDQAPQFEGKKLMAILKPIDKKTV